MYFIVFFLIWIIGFIKLIILQFVNHPIIHCPEATNVKLTLQNQATPSQQPPAWDSLHLAKWPPLLSSLLANRKQLLVTDFCFVHYIIYFWLKKTTICHDA